jgi:hypothetical protein
MTEILPESAMLRAPGARQDDVFEHAMRQVYRPAAPELVAGFREKMDFIKLRYKHNERTVESCLNGLGPSPTLLQLLTAAFVVNGGVLFKHGPTLDEEETEEQELSKLIQEFDQLRGVQEDETNE